MRAGWTISITVHAAFVVVALWGNYVLQPDDRLDLSRVSDVTIIDASEFDAMQATAPPPAAPEVAPEVDLSALDPMTAPEFNADAGPPPEADQAPVATIQDFVEDPSERDREADLTALTQQIAQPEVAVDLQIAEDTPQMPQMETALSLPGTGDAPVTSAPRAPERATPPAPRDAPRIAGTDSPPPPTPTPPAEEESAAAEESETAEAEETLPPEQAAPEESASAISPEEASGEEDGTALRVAAPPRARPRDFAEQVAEAARRAEEEAIARAEAERRAAEEEAARRAEAAERERQEAEAREIEDALRQAQEQQPQQPDSEGTGQSATDLPPGPPLTAGERDGLRLAIQRCWNVPAGLPNDTELKVVVAVELDPGGRIVGQIELIEPANASRPEIRVAYEAARRALLRCQGSGYDLPRDKYEQWKNLEVSFNPEGVLERW